MLKLSGHKRRCVGALALLLSSSTALASAAVSNPPAPALVQAAKRHVESLDKPNTPGCVLGANHLGKPVFRSAFGVANLATGARNTPALAFGGGSVTKQFTAAAVAIAISEGRFAENDDIRKYLPEMRAAGPVITIAQLVHHTSGMRDVNRLIELTGSPAKYASRESRIALLGRQLHTNFPPGSEHRYSNSGYMLLAEIIERTTGRTFGQYVQEKIFAPLGMSHSYFGETSRGTQGRALPYELKDGGWDDSDPLFSGGELGYSGLMTTLDDYGRWADNFVAPRSKLAGGQALLRKLQAPAVLNDGSTVPYGYGLRLGPYRGLRTIGHGGSAYGYKAATMMFPDRGLSVFSFCNNGDYPDPIVGTVADLLLQVKASAAAAPATRTPVVPLPAAALQRFEGLYREPSLRLPLVVAAKDGKLVIDGAGHPFVFEPIGPNLFRDENDVLISFEPDASGKGMILNQLEGVHFRFGTGRFERIEPARTPAADLGALAGRYGSAELQASYDFVVQDGVLQARIVDSEKPRVFSFRPMIADEFVSIPDRLVLRFTRTDGAVTGFVLTHQFGWITDVIFARS